MKRKSLIQWFGLLGILSLLSYTIAVIFSPLAYPNYHWISQAVSDLSALDSPSRTLWNQLSSLYGVCGVVSITMVCVFIQNKLNRLLRVGIYMFAIMQWISYIGFTIFPLTKSGNAGTFQDAMHLYAVTIPVVALSIISLVTIIIGGYHNRRYKTLVFWASLSLLLMFIGAIGVNILPQEYFGIPERFSVFAATGFNAILGGYLFHGFKVDIY